MIHVYVLERDDAIVYVGATCRPKEREVEHRSKRQDRALNLRIAATYSSVIAGYRAEQVAWCALALLGAPLENRRPTGKPETLRRAPTDYGLTAEQYRHGRAG